MPEGDTVWRTARRLAAALAGERLELAEIRWGEVDAGPLQGGVVSEVLPRGKHLLHRVDTGWTLHTHLRMEGSWRVAATGSDDARRGLRRPDLRVALGSARWTTLGLRLGMVDLLRTDEEDRVVGHLGPDLLGPDWDEAEAVRRVAASPATIAEALLDQRNLAGIGTFWASEALFVERVHPWTPVVDLADGVAAEVVVRARELMLRGREHAIQSSTGVLRKGEEAYVHARSGRPCRRCGETIRVAPIGTPPRERVFFSCPGCQGGLAPTDDGAPQAPLGAAGRGGGAGRPGPGVRQPTRRRPQPGRRGG